MIKKVFWLTCVGIIFWYSLVSAGDTTLKWAANSETNIAGYKIHYGTAHSVYDTTVDVGNVLTYVLPLNVGTYYIVITAYDTNANESEYSYEIVLPVVLSQVTGFYKEG